MRVGLQLGFVSVAVSVSVNVSASGSGPNSDCGCCLHHPIIELACRIWLRKHNPFFLAPEELCFCICTFVFMVYGVFGFALGCGLWSVLITNIWNTSFGVAASINICG